MKDGRSWDAPDWEPEEGVGFEDAAFGSVAILTVILLGGLGVGVVAALWHLL